MTELVPLGVVLSLARVGEVIISIVRVIREQWHVRPLSRVALEMHMLQGLHILLRCRRVLERIQPNIVDADLWPVCKEALLQQKYELVDSHVAIDLDLFESVQQLDRRLGIAVMHKVVVPEALAKHLAVPAR